MASARFLLFIATFSVVQHRAWHVAQKKMEAVGGSAPPRTLQLMHFADKNNDGDERTANECAIDTVARSHSLCLSARHQQYPLYRAPIDAAARIKEIHKSHTNSFKHASRCWCWVLRLEWNVTHCVRWRKNGHGCTINNQCCYSCSHFHENEAARSQSMPIRSNDYYSNTKANSGSAISPRFFSLSLFIRILFIFCFAVTKRRRQNSKHNGNSLLGHGLLLNNK